MALNPTGAISLGGPTTGQSVAVELGLSGTAQISLNDTVVRTLAGVASGAIVMPSDFWGKSNFTAGLQIGIFGFGTAPSGSVSTTNLVSNTGVIASDTPGVGTARNQTACAGYASDGKGVFIWGQPSAYNRYNLVSTSGVVASDTSIPSPIYYRRGTQVAGYGGDKSLAIGGVTTPPVPGAFPDDNIWTISNTGVITLTPVVTTARGAGVGTEYGGDKGIVMYGRISPTSPLFSPATSNLISNTGTVATSTPISGTGREFLAGAGYGGDKAIVGLGTLNAGSPSSYTSAYNLVSNTGVVSADTPITPSVLRAGSAASTYGGDKAIFAFGFVPYAYVNTSFLVSNTGVFGSAVPGVGTSRGYLGAHGLSYQSSP